MSSTSKILQPDDGSTVSPIWWRDTSQPKPKPAQKAAAEAEAEKPVFPPEERERIEREAYQRGFSEGKSLGKEQTAAEVHAVIERLSRSISDISALRPRMRREAEKDLVKLSIAIARRVLHRELTLDPESIEGLIRVALDRLESRELCTVRVHPDQQDAVRVLLDRFSNSRKIEMIVDKSLRLGDVLLTTEHGTIDASVDAQLSEIERGFADRLEK